MRLLLATLCLLTANAVAQNATAPIQTPSSQAPTNQIQTFPTPDTKAREREKSRDTARAMVILERQMQMLGCPVGLTAEQRGGGQTLWTIALEDQRGRRMPFDRSHPAGSGVHVQLSSPVHTIRQVELSVAYQAPGVAAVPVITVRSPIERRKTFTLTADGGNSFRLAGDLLVGLTAGIERVYLLSVDYSDGTSWHPSPDHACSVAPNRLLLIGAR